MRIIGNDALPVGEIFPKHEIYDYECKYTAGMAHEVFPAELVESETQSKFRTPRDVHSARSSSAGARELIFECRPTASFYCLEANTLPGMTQTSLVPQAAAAAGISFPALCDRIVATRARAHGAERL